MRAVKRPSTSAFPSPRWFIDIDSKLCAGSHIPPFIRPQWICDVATIPRQVQGATHTPTHHQLFTSTVSADPSSLPQTRAIVVNGPLESEIQIHKPQLDCVLSHLYTQWYMFSDSGLTFGVPCWRSSTSLPALIDINKLFKLNHSPVR